MTLLPLTLPALVAFAAAAALAAVHVFAGHLMFLHHVPRARLLSVAGGVSVAYVFVYLLPELHAAQNRLLESADGIAAALEHHVYLLALAGLGVFYGLEQLAVRARRERSRQQAEHEAAIHEERPIQPARRASIESPDPRNPPSPTGPGVFWLHVGSFAVYNALIGYVLVDRKESGILSVATFVLAIGLHFVANDYGLRQHHQLAYQRYGRWVLAVSVLFGWGMGIALSVPELVLSLIVAFLAGGIILNVLKEELPAERESRFWPFAAGAAGYTILLLLV